MGFTVPWAEGATDLADDVHVWNFSLDRGEAFVRRVAPLLADDERERAERFHFEHDRNRFLVRRGILRMLLASYLDVEPGEVRLRTEPRGKLVLDVNDEARSLRFNTSHSKALGVCAIVRKREIGVDVERVRPIPDARQVTEHFFSARERAELSALPSRDYNRGFYTIWTGKEAYLKAIGDGLWEDPKGIEVAAAPQGPAALLSVNGSDAEARRWSMRHLTLPAGYLGSLLVEGPDFHIVERPFIGRLG
jgi:4'-phosphopantetheinyl transferase